MRNPWKTLNTREVYKNGWIRLREDQVLRPRGGEGIYSVVEARLAVGVIALNEDHEIHLVGQYRYPTSHYSWEIIEGGSEEGESALDTAKRELREEAGLVAKSWRLLGAGKFELSNCHSDERAVLFLATELSQVDAEPDPTELLRLKTAPAYAVMQMVRDGQITDVMSMVALYQLAEIMPSLVLAS